MSAPDLVPVRMLNEFTYCKRLFHLEWVQSEWADNDDTAEGTWNHRVVDQPKGQGPSTDAERAATPSTSIMVSSEHLGLIGKVDVLHQLADGSVVPVDYKKGSAPQAPEVEPF